MRRLTVFLLFLVTILAIPFSAIAGELIVHDFVKGSLQEIKTQRHNQPFIMVFWSKDCGYCFTEMNMLADMQPEHPDLDIVLVSIDTGLGDEMVKHFFEQTGLEADEIWVFSDTHDDTSTLYSYVDQGWKGETPNTLFHNRKHEYQSVFGEVKYSQVKNWLQYIREEDS